jgi:hypothetical protein
VRTLKKKETEINYQNQFTKWKDKIEGKKKFDNRSEKKYYYNPQSFPHILGFLLIVNVLPCDKFLLYNLFILQNYNQIAFVAG